MGLFIDLVVYYSTLAFSFFVISHLGLNHNVVVEVIKVRHFIVG